MRLGTVLKLSAQNSLLDNCRSLYYHTMRIDRLSLIALVAFVLPTALLAQIIQTPASAESTKVELTNAPAPNYPKLAVDNHLSGMVVLRAVVNDQGGLALLNLETGHPLLVPSAFEAAKSYRFQPYVKQGKPVPFWTTLTFCYTAVNGKYETMPGVAGTAHFPPEQIAVPIVEIQKNEENAATSNAIHVQRVLPTYPEETAPDHRSADVTVAFTISDQGQLTSAMVIGGDRAFQPATIEALRQWKFTPFRRAGKAIRVGSIVTFHFQFGQPTTVDTAAVPVHVQHT